MSRDEREYHAAEVAKREYFLTRFGVGRESEETLVTEPAAEALQRWYRLVAPPTRHA